VLPVEEDFLKGSILHKGGGPTGSLLYEGLVTKNSQGGYDGWLARSWESKDNGKEWVFSLVRNAFWHDGVKFTAKDVKFTYNYLKEKQIWLSAVLWMVEKVECQGDYTVIFHLKSCFPKFLDHLSHCPGIAIIPKHIWRCIDRPMRYKDHKYIGTGPFQFVKKIPGQFFEMKSFDSYHGSKPEFGRVVLRVIRNPDMQVMALKKGDIDATDNVLPWMVEVLDKRDDIKVSSFPRQRMYELCFNCKESPTSSVNLRKALAHAVDKEKICKVIFRGYAQPAKSWLMPHLASDYTNETMFAYHYDLSLAQNILQKNGFKLKNGQLQNSREEAVRLVLVLGAKGNINLARKIAELLQEDWRKMGLTIDITQVDFSMWFREVHKNNLFIIGMPDLMHDDPDDLTHFRSHSFFGKPNWHDFFNAEYDALAAKLHKTNAPAKRKRLAFAMQQILAEEVPSVPICEVDGLIAYRSDRISLGHELESMYGGILDLKTLLTIKPVN
jgi:peptide/nickel transport system substrate-binding protein